MDLIAVRRVRLAAGLVLLAYVTLHFVNHALGLVSLAGLFCLVLVGRALLF